MPNTVTPRRSALRPLTALLLAGLGFLSAEAAQAAQAAQASDWQAALRAQIERIDRESPGSLGLYVKRLDTGETLSYGADRFWYLGSTVKVPIAITLLQQVDAGQRKLSERATLEATDRIEAGRLVWSAPGTTFALDELLKRMLGESDNTAANMLIRTVGAEPLNELTREAMGAQRVHRLTTLAQVRYDVYAQVHPDARKLSNDQLVRIASAPLGPQRIEALRSALGVPASSLKTSSMVQAYDRYYATGQNAATLEGYGAMLEKLVRNQLLGLASTQRLFKEMKIDIFTNYRLQAGLPRSVRFIHKTGTQYRRACHAGVIEPQNAGAHGIVVVTCAADLDEQKEAGKVFERVGRAVSQTVLANR